MFDPDKPITSRRQDKLDRKGFANFLAGIILKYKNENSTAIGLSGEWGSGKTSVIQMTLECIEELSPKTDNKPIIINFNPWNFSDQNSLIANFFDELSSSLSDDDRIEMKIKLYVEKLTSSILLEDKSIIKRFKWLLRKLIHIVAFISSIVAPTTTQSIISYAKYVEEKNPNLESLKTEIKNSLIEKDCKIIIIIDDIDRLQDFEIRQIFQLVKILADFPKTIYLLAYDSDVVKKALEGVQIGSGKKYLEKVIQLPLEIPTITKSRLEDLLFTQINIILEDLPENRYNQVYWSNLYHSGLKYLFNTIRDVKRFTNSLKITFEMVKTEVNPADFMAIIAIQIFLPEVYLGIRDNKDLFAGIDFTGHDYGSMKRQAETRCEEIIERADQSIQEKLRDLFKYMFPKLNAVYGNTHYGNEWLSTWRRELRICSPEKFDIYFRLSIPEDEISQSEINILLSLTKDSKSFAEALLKLNEDGRIIQFLERFEDYTKDVPKDNINNIVNVLMDIGDLFPDTKKGMFDFGTPMRISRIIYQLMRRFNNFEDRYKILENAMKNSKNSLFILVQKVGIEDSVHGKYGLAEQPDPKERWTVNSEQLIKLEKIAADKIHEWADDGRLAKHEHLVEILFDWRRWEPKEVIKFVNDVIETDEGLIEFISSFLNKQFKYTITDQVSEPIWTMSLENIEIFVKLDEIEPRIKNIASSSDFDQLDNKNKLAILCFLKKIDNTNSDEI